jgi:hypothetical protein
MMTTKVGDVKMSVSADDANTAKHLLEVATDAVETLRKQTERVIG